MAKNNAIPLSGPDITKREVSAVLEVLRTRRLCFGPKLKEFERRVAEHTGVRHAVAVNSGTSALHLLVRALGIKAGDEVIVPSFTFIATANCVLFEKARPVFVDIEPQTLNIDVSRIERSITRNTRAIIAVDVFGHPADWDALEKTARKYKLKIIEDSAEALGAEYKGKKAGSFGAAGIFAFYPNKQITTGEGGMIVTDNKRIAEECLSMRNQGRGSDGQWLNHVRLGYNYRLSDLNCALGVVQMERLPSIIRQRAKVAALYSKLLSGREDFDLPFVSDDVTMSWFVYVIRLKERFSFRERDSILNGLRRRGIGCSNYFAPIHLQPFYRKMFGLRPGDLPVTESVAGRTIALPFYTSLKKDDVCRICEALSQELRRVTRKK